MRGLLPAPRSYNVDNSAKVANALEGQNVVGGPIIDGLVSVLMAQVEKRLPEILDALFAAVVAAVQKWLAPKA